MYKEELKKVLDNTVVTFKTSNDKKEKVKLFNEIGMYHKLLEYIDENEDILSGYIDKKHHFIEIFNRKTGFYARTGVIENDIDTGKDAFMRDFPQLIDVGVMG